MPIAATDTDTALFNRLDVMTAGAASVILASSLLFGHQLHIPSFVLAGPLATLIGLWMFRYFKGYKLSGTDTRKPISAAHACLLLGSAAIAAAAVLSVKPLAQTKVSASELHAWSAVMVLTLVLVSARGHEKRLRGAYAIQNTWLTLNKPHVVTKFLGDPKPGTEPVLPDPIVGAVPDPSAGPPQPT